MIQEPAPEEKNENPVAEPVIESPEAPVQSSKKTRKGKSTTKKTTEKKTTAKKPSTKKKSATV